MEGFRGILFGEHPEVFRQREDVDEEKDHCHNGTRAVIDRPRLVLENGYRHVRPGIEDIQCEHGNYYQPRLRGAEARVGEAELVHDDRGEVGVDRHTEVSGEDEERDRHVHQRAQAQADAEEASGQRVEGVVDEEAVLRALRVPYAGQCAVKAVAIPVEHKAGRRGPKIVDIVV